MAVAGAIEAAGNLNRGTPAGRGAARSRARLGMAHQLDTHDELTVPCREAFLGINLSCI